MMYKGVSMKAKSTGEQIVEFLKKCEQLKKSKFIMATTRIKDLLKCIVNSPVLYELFQAATAHFDYVSAKRKYFVSVNGSFLGERRLVLPESAGERLAFIFCLLVEFDHDTINFNEFLQQFFPEDGSYYASFRSFCNLVIDSMEDILRDVFSVEVEGAAPHAQVQQVSYVAPPSGAYNAPKTNTYSSEAVLPHGSVSSFGVAMPQPQQIYAEMPVPSRGLQQQPVQAADEYSSVPPRPVPNPDAAEKFTAVSMLVAYERDLIARSLMPEADKQDGYLMLGEIEAAVREGRTNTMYAVLRGYEYYSACHNNFSQFSIMLRSTLGGSD